MTVDLYHAAKHQATALKDEPVAILFSGGKDAIAMAHVWRSLRHAPQRWVYFYFVDGLEIVENTLRYYERAWNITIDRRPCHETMSLLSRERGGRKYTFSDIERNYREETGIRWTLSGAKRSDSMARRGMLKHLGPEGIDHKNGKAYPVIDWTHKQALQYCKMNKLPLPLTYACGISWSFWIPTCEDLIWLRGKYPGDYQKIVDTFPQFGDAVFRRDNGGG